MNTVKPEPQLNVKSEDFSSWEAILKIGGWHAPQKHGIGGAMNRGPNLIDRRDYLNKDSTLPSIPSLDEIIIPADMPERLKKDVWRCLKTLKREYEDQSKEDTMTPPEDYARLGNWDQKKKQDRRRMQNRKAARRFRVKNLEVVWAMVTSYQKVQAENEALRQQVKLLGGEIAPPGMPRLSMPSLPPTVQGDLRIKQEPNTPTVDDQSVTPTEIIKIPPPLPPITRGTPASKKRKLEIGAAAAGIPPSDAAWIVQKNAVDLVQQDLLTLTVVCGKQDLASIPDQELIRRLTAQAAKPEFAIQEASLSESATPVRAPKQWIDAIQAITNGN